MSFKKKKEKIHVALPFHLPERERERVLFILDATVFNIIAHTGGQTIICAREGAARVATNKARVGQVVAFV